MSRSPRGYTLPAVLHAERERKTGSSYHWKNRDRRPVTTYVIQRTVSGCVLLGDGRSEQTAEPGQAIIFRYGESTEYRIGAPSTWPYVNEYVVLTDACGLGELLDQLRAGFGPVVRMEEKGEAARILHSLVLKFRHRETWDDLELAEIAYRLVIALFREQITGTRGNDPVAYLRHQLQHQFRSPKSIKEWIQDLPRSREHVSRVFRERYGESPAAYLRRMRLDHARLLAHSSSSMTAEAIAAASGFTNAQTLRRAFQRQFGQTLGSL